MKYQMKYWPGTFIRLAEFWAGESKDPSTKVGAVIVRPDNTVAAEGYNGFPRDMEDYTPWLENREEKLARTIHAEMNAILIAREQLHGYHLYTWPLPVCDRCIVHIAQKGITRIVSKVAVPPETYARWEKSCARAKEIADSCGVEYIIL
jgi:dCMP deaminase